MYRPFKSAVSNFRSWINNGVHENNLYLPIDLKSSKANVLYPIKTRHTFELNQQKINKWT